MSLLTRITDEIQEQWPFTLRVKEFESGVNQPTPDEFTGLAIIRGGNNTTEIQYSDGKSWYSLTANTPARPTTLSGISPVSGDKAGGYTLTIYGQDIVANSVVRIGGSTATVLSNNGTSISVTVPAHSIGINDVTVTDPSNKTVALVNAFTYTEVVLPIPVISSISSNNPGETTATITFLTDLSCTSWIEWGLTTSYSSSNFPGNAANTSHSHNLTGLTPASTYHYRIHVIDINNNEVLSTDQTFVTDTPVVFPVISAIDDGTPTQTGATITFNTDIATDDYIEYGLTTSYGFQTTLNPTLATSHSIPITGLTANTLYHYKIHVRSAASAETVSTDQTFTTAAAPGLTTVALWDNAFDPTTAGAPGEQVSHLTLGTKFKSSVAGDVLGVRYYKKAGNAACTVKLWGPTGTLLATKDNTTESASGWQEALFDTPVAISAETTYTVSYEPTVFTNNIAFYDTADYFNTARVVDVLTGYAAGGVSPGNGVFNTASGYPNTYNNGAESYFVNPVFRYGTGGGEGGLSISNINVSNISQSSAQINWSLSAPGTGYYEVGTVPGIYTITNNPGETTLNYSAHSQYIAGLSPNTLYYYRVRSTNAGAIETISEVNTFTTLAQGTGYNAPPPTNSLVVNVRDHGAVGNGTTDDTAAIQAAVNSVAGTGGTVLVPAGTYRVIASASGNHPAISLGSNMTFKLDPGAILKLDGNDYGVHCIIQIEFKTNVNVVGTKGSSVLWGERNRHIGDPSWNESNALPIPGGETGHCLFIGGSSNIYVDGIRAIEAWGDGFLGASNYDPECSNINFFNCEASDNRRQAMSIENVNGIQVRNCDLNNTHNEFPGAGIDIEPIGPTNRVTNMTIDDVRCNNNKTGILLEGTPSNNDISYITVNNVSLNNNQFSGLLWRNPGVGSSYSNVTGTGNGSGLISVG